MDDTITLTGSTGDTVFSSKTRNGSAVKWFAPSAAADLAGRPTLVISNDITKAGIARATATLTKPLLDTVSGQYKQFVRANVTVTQPANLGVSEPENIVAMLADALATYGSDIVEATA